MKLKGIPEKILEKFRINPSDLDNTIKGTMNYLNSKELNEIKFGSFIIRRFFSELVRIDDDLNTQGKKLDFKIDDFLKNDVINSIGKVLSIESNIDIISELTWALVNITYFDAENDGYSYIKQFMNQTYLNIFYKLTLPLQHIPETSFSLRFSAKQCRYPPDPAAVSAWKYLLN